MFRKRSVTILPVITFALFFIFAGQPAQADWGVSFYGEVQSPDYSYYGDRITSEYRRGYQVDDWIERGDSSVTESPISADGIRLAAWADGNEENYEYALASAIYFFEIPSSARSVRIKVSYDGEADRSDFNGGIAGRVWIKRARLGDDYEEYYPSEGRYEDADEPLYGDTFVLRASKQLEIIRVSAEDHVVDGIMELHVVAEGRQRIDVKYIEVETYSFLPRARVITRYYRDYAWQPWSDYTYWYFYTGPTYHFADYYYVRYTYPRYHDHYVEIRKRYNDYLRVYYVNRPYRHARWVDVVYVSKGTHRTWDRDRLTRWTPDHEEARRSYEITSMKTRRPADIQKARERVRSVLADHSRSSPAAVRARSDETVAAPSKERIRSAASSSRIEVDRSRSSERPSAQVETRDSAKTRRDDVRSSVRTRSSTSSQTERERSVRQAPTGSTRQEQPGRTPDSERVKIRREVKTRTPESKSREVKTAPTRSEPRKQAPPKAVKTDKDDDDDDKDKKSSSNSTSQRPASTRSSSSGSSSEKTRRGR